MSQRENHDETLEKALRQMLGALGKQMTENTALLSHNLANSYAKAGRAVQDAANETLVQMLLARLPDAVAQGLWDRLFGSGYLDTILYDPHVRLRMEATAEATEIIRNNLKTALLFPYDEMHWPKMIDYALSRAGDDGLYLEFGVAQGKSIIYIAGKKPRQTIHGFDSFEGLPGDWFGGNYAAGSFSLNGKLPPVPPNVLLHKGWYRDTLPGFAAENAGRTISFMHVDVDLYESTKDIFNHLGHLVAEGTVIVFDEYFNYPSWQEHEAKAFAEFCAAQGVEYHFIVFQQTRAGLVIDKILGRPA